ncbi:MAG TPA: hypothetical protein P5114_06615 [Hyphomicrobiaceae bacterium]|nr:hypothetical protein [Hyphomicrobiaceae bacterium]
MTTSDTTTKDTVTNTDTVSDPNSTDTAITDTTATQTPAPAGPAANPTDPPAPETRVAEALAETPQPMPMREAPAPHNQRQRGPIARFFRSLFSHLMFAGVTVAVVLGYLYHAPILRDVGDTVCADKVLGQWMSAPPGTVLAGRTNSPARAEAQAGIPKPAASAPTPTAPTPSATTSADQAGQAETTAEREPVATAPAAPAGPASKSAATNIPAALLTTEKKQIAAAPQNVSAPLPQSETSTSPPQGGEAGTASAPEAMAPSSSRAQLLKEWAAAREAFAKGKPEAVSAYLNLAKRFPDVPELTGELGNIYFQQGNMEAAASQYYETAQRLMRLGQPGPAACLVNVLRNLDADKAKTLDAQTSVPCPVPPAVRN